MQTKQSNEVQFAPSLTLRGRPLAPYALAITRIVAAFLFIQGGTAKIIAFPAAIMPEGGVAPLLSLVGIAGLLEAVGGAFIFVGAYTRPVAFVLCGQMAVAYFMGHAPQDFWPVLNGGIPAVLFCFVWLHLFVAGAGAWSIDALRHRSAASRAARRVAVGVREALSAADA